MENNRARLLSSTQRMQRGQVLHLFTMIPQTDQELYDSLPERLQGMTWASLPDERR